MSDVDPLSGAYCKKHDIYLCEDCVSKPIGQTSDGYHTFDELYEHRHALFIALCHYVRESNGPSAWKSKLHSDGTMFEGWFIAGIGVKAGQQITYHMPLSLWDKLHICELDKAFEWDGHTPADCVRRLLDL